MVFVNVYIQFSFLVILTFNCVNNDMTLSLASKIDHSQQHVWLKDSVVAVHIIK